MFANGSELPETKDDQNVTSPWIPQSDISPHTTYTSVMPGIYYPRSPTEAVGKHLR